MQYLTTKCKSIDGIPRHQILPILRHKKLFFLLTILPCRARNVFCWQLSGYIAHCTANKLLNWSNTRDSQTVMITGAVITLNHRAKEYANKHLTSDPYNSIAEQWGGSNK